jgi:Uma2 family endonuclease
MGMPAEVRRRWSAQDARDLQREDRAFPRYEVIDGELLVTPAPSLPHQYMAGELFRRLKNYLDGNRELEAWMSPADIQLETDTVVQPDVFVAPRIRPIPQWAAIKTLALAIEVLSPGSLKHDRSIKRRFYQRRGVGEYWIGDLNARQIERWRPGDTRPEVIADVIDWRAAGSDVPLVIELPLLFDECAELGGEM